MTHLGGGHNPGDRFTDQSRRGRHLSSRQTNILKVLKRIFFLNLWDCVVAPGKVESLIFSDHILQDILGPGFLLTADSKPSDN